MSFGRRQSSDAGSKPATSRRKPRGPVKADGKVVSFAESGNSAGARSSLRELTDQVVETISTADEAPDFSALTRAELADFAAQASSSILKKVYDGLNQLEQRNLVTAIVNKLYVPAKDLPSASDQVDADALGQDADIAEQQAAAEERRRLNASAS